MLTRTWLLLIPLALLTLGLTFTAGSVLGSNLAKSILQPYPHVTLAQAGGPAVGPPPPLVPAMFGLDRGTIVLAGVVPILVILLTLVLISKDGTWTIA